MKTHKFIAAAIIAAGVAGSASAQTVINITGATAFRQVAHQAILDSLDLANRTYGYAGSNIGNAGMAMFKGTINAGVDEVIVRTSWSGSVAGIRAVVNQANAVTYFANTANNTALLTANGTANMNATATTANETTGNDICFADNAQENTPFNAVTLSGGPVGVIVFVPVVNETASITEGESISTLQLRRLMTAGKAPLQFITGNSSHNNKKIYWTGRNDLSGTRVIYNAEMGIGASGTVQQYLVYPTTTNATVSVSDVRLWPTGDGNNVSNIWGSETAGNGGYNSGGALVPVLQRTSTSVTERDSANASVASAVDAVLCTVISVQDAEDIQIGGGKVLAYNGVYIEPAALPTGISATDRAKVAKGDYTLWSYERLFYRDSVPDDTVKAAFITLLEGQVTASGNIGGNGLAISDMRVSRSSSSDGGSLSVSLSLP
jgi:hypothetical protein